jgi:hypothetical protein
LAADGAGAAGERVRRIGVLMPYDENDPVMKTRLSAFTQAPADFGWTVGRNLRMDLRWSDFTKINREPEINRLRGKLNALLI